MATTFNLIGTRGNVIFSWVLKKVSCYAIHLICSKNIALQVCIEIPNIEIRCSFKLFFFQMFIFFLLRLLSTIRKWVTFSTTFCAPILTRWTWWWWRKLWMLSLIRSEETNRTFSMPCVIHYLLKPWNDALRCSRTGSVI